MAVYRVERTRDYTVMSNYHLKDTSLSLKAKGLLSMFLSFPEDWNYSTRGLAAICKEGVDAIGSTIKELEKAGYIIRRQLRGANGRITDTEYIIYEKPQPPEPDADEPDMPPPDTASPHTENPDVAGPDMVAPHTENPAQLNINQFKTQKSNTQRSNTHSFPPPAPSETPAQPVEGMKEIFENALLERLRAGTLHFEDFCMIRAARVSHYITKDGAELDALVDENNKIYLGRRNRYDNHGHYINDGKSLLYLSDNEKMFDFISGGGYSDTQAELLAQSYFTMEDYAEFDALRVGVLAQFEQTEPLLFAGEPFSFIQPDAAALEQPAPEPLEQTDAALYLVDGATYLHIQISEGSYDYTLYDKATLRQLDGGQMAILDVGGSPQANFRNAADLIILGERNMQGTSVEPVPLDMLDTLQNAEEQAVQAAVTEVQDQRKNHLDELREHFAQEDDALWDTPLDEYPLPDPAFPADELEQNYGYTGGDLLPLSRERAAELLEQDLSVYMVEAGENPAMVFDRDDLMEQPEGMMFAVTREEWEASRDFRQAVVDRMQHQPEREKAFLDHAADCFAIYQVRDDDVLRDIRFESLDWLKSKGRAVERDNYDLVYTAPLSAFASVDAALDQLWYQFNNEHPADFQHPSMSVSDIIALKRDGVVTCHYCDSFGFEQLADFISQKPTVAELEAQVKAGQTISLTDLADAVHREKGQKKSVVAQLKSQPAQERKKTAPKKSAEKER